MMKKCQVFTPVQTVIELLNMVDYNSNLYGKKVIENACGDGNILTVIVKRYIEDARYWVPVTNPGPFLGS